MDCDVAKLYGIETKRVNEALKNNPDKFPKGYVISVKDNELPALRSKISTAKVSTMNRALPTAFTEKGLYMLATILKSKQATATTLAIVEAFSKMRELSRTLAQMTKNPDEFQQKRLIEKGSNIFSELFSSDLETKGTTTEVEVNFAMLKFKHTIQREKKD